MKLIFGSFWWEIFCYQYKSCNSLTIVNLLALLALTGCWNTHLWDRRTTRQVVVLTPIAERHHHQPAHHHKGHADGVLQSRWSSIYEACSHKLLLYNSGLRNRARSGGERRRWLKEIKHSTCIWSPPHWDVLNSPGSLRTLSRWSQWF